MKNQQHARMRLYRGEPISSGVAMGKILVFNDVLGSRLPKVTIPADRIGEERRRLLRAFDATHREIEDLVRKVHREIGLDESSIFRAHILILNDRKFSGEMVRLIEEERLSAESAVRLVTEDWEHTFSSSQSADLQMKVFDIIDIGKRILSKLSLKETGMGLTIGGRNLVLASRLLLPSITAFIDRTRILGIVTELGNRASHSAVIAKAMGIPAVFGVQNLVKNIRSGDEVIVDGSSGIVYVNPDAAIKKEYETFRKKYHVFRKRLDNLTDLPSLTKDGREIELHANIGAYADVDMALKYRVKGVGLYRTEMPFLIRNEFPEEELQYSIYKKVIDKMKGKPVSIRTLDLGGDKILSFLSMPKEENPNLGWRAIRVFIDNPHFFKVQLKAILRAAAGANVGIILPMISDLTEVRITKKILADAKRELMREGRVFNNSTTLGIMVEVPSAVFLAEHLIEEVDFLSIGTNDLIQYTLAVDRNSEKAARYFEPLNPAVIVMLKRLADVAAAAGKSVSICGEVASEPLYIPILVGMGYTKFSVNPLAVNLIKDIVRSVRYDDSRALVHEVLRRKTAKEVRAFMLKYFAGIRTQVRLLDLEPPHH